MGKSNRIRLNRAKTNVSSLGEKKKKNGEKRLKISLKKYGVGSEDYKCEIY